MGKAERSDPNKYMATWTPSPLAYNLMRDALDNESPAFKYIHSVTNELLELVLVKDMKQRFQTTQAQLIAQST